MGFFKAAVVEAKAAPMFDYDQQAYYGCPATPEEARTSGWQVNLSQCLHQKTSTKQFMRNAFIFCETCDKCYEAAKRATIRDRKRAEKRAEEEDTRQLVSREFAIDAEYDREMEMLAAENRARRGSK